MKYYLFTFAMLLLFFSACEETASSNSTVTKTKTEEKTDNEKINGITSPPENQNIIASQQKKTHNCKAEGKILKDKNEFWIQDQNTLVRIIADQSTHDDDLGNSHRRLVVYNTENCKPITAKTFPINRSPDFPYYISKNTYEDKNKIVGIQGYDVVYCYDVENQQLLEKLEPQYFGETEAQDAQSGSPQGLAIWDHYLIGYELDYGAFAFDLSNKQKAKAVLATAEFNNNGKSNQLFLLSTANGNIQAIIPELIKKDGTKEVKLISLFRTPKKINPSINRKVRNNRFIILKGNNKNSLAIDMKSKKQINLPPDIKVKSAKDILKWIKENVK